MRWKLPSELALATAVMVAGCDDASTATAPTRRNDRRRLPDRPFNVTAEPSGGTAAAKPASTANPAGEPGRTNDLLPGDPTVPAISPQRRAIDEQQVRDQGIRRLQGRHLTLYTDLPADPLVDELPAAFDQAVPQWCVYFGVDAAQPTVADWRVTGYLMRDKNKFWAAGLWSDELPDFQTGYYIGPEFWLFEQPSPYYRRHLLLHEGTHVFMLAFVPGVAPPWYAEGLAELLGTHAWRDGRLTLGHFPRAREETPEWGRIKLVQDAYSDRQALVLERVLALGEQARLDVRQYAWCWAAAAFLDGHPRYQARFRELVRDQEAGDVNTRLRAAFAEDWPDLVEEWQVFVGNIEYGFDLKRASIDFRPGDPLPAEGATVDVAADRGWQCSGFQLEANQAYDLTASGRYRLAAGPPAWPCEPGGVSIRYHQGRPLGVLQAAVLPDRRDPAALSALLQPHEVGLHTRLVPTESGALYLRVNDSPAELADNQGTLRVTIRRADPPVEN
jgi:hypothetical protein